MTTIEKEIDRPGLDAFVGQAVTDMGAAISGLLLHIGDRLGLYRAMAGAGRSRRPRWRPGPFVNGSETRRPAATWSTTRRMAPSNCPLSRPWSSPTRTARSSWPEPSSARTAAAKAGVAQRVKFETRPAKQLPAAGYDLVCMFDCLHDMGDPVGAARHIRETLAPDGTLLLVEPMAGDRLEDNLNPVGRTFYGLSTVICTPGSLAQEVGVGLGAQAGERQLSVVLREAGFSHVRLAAQTPFNLVLEAKP